MDSVYAFAAWWTVILAMVAVARLLGAQLRTGWLLVAMALQAAYFIAILYGGRFISIEAIVGETAWNWNGKIASIISTLTMICLLSMATRAVSFQNVGLTLRQEPGSFRPAMIATIVLTLLVVSLEIAANDGRNIALETLAYQATMPGLDEEPFFRGLLLAVMIAALPASSFRLLGARITLAGVLISILFGLGHGLSVQNGDISLNWPIIIITGFLGFWLNWIRERTGSLLMPIFAHNLINFSGMFF